MATPVLAGDIAQRFNLKVEQIIAAKVIETRIALQTVAVELAGHTVQLKTPPGFRPLSGDTLQLQVQQLQPTLEFRVLPPNTASAPAVTLTLAVAGAKPASITLPSVPTPTSQAQIPPNARLPAQVVEVSSRGITLQLLATSEGGQRSAAAPPLLTLDSRQLQWPDHLAAKALKPGAAVELQPIDTAGGKAQFSIRVVEPASTHHDIIDALKTLLPIQDTPKTLLHHISLVLPQMTQAPNVAETLTFLARSILQTLPQATDLTHPQGLQTAIRDSGLFMESKLAALLHGGLPMLHDDVKVKLCKLEQLLLTQTMNPSPAQSATQDLLNELLHETRAALAGLVLDQLNSLPKDDASRQVWTLELPFWRGGEVDSVHIEIEIEIERETGERADAAGKRWAVNLTLTPPSLATIHCTISCYDGSINTRFWSQSADTVSRIDRHLDHLKQQFEAQGLKAGFMDAHQGQSTSAQNPLKPPFKLLNEKA
ncbi:MAG: flagellar hook-length control protein FliK [Methylomonas sp.]|nr:flagellar hook-length control protein FliK [Methylomonas sp.]